jgi:F-type H+-transporting ATPase subunit alpha
LKQPQYAPVPVEEQVAILVASTKGWLDKVPVVKVRDFEKELLTLLRLQNKSILDNFRAGKFEDSDLDALKKVTIDLSSKY